MSAIACVLDRRGGAVDAGRLGALAEGLADYGEAVSTLRAGSVGVAVRHAPGDGAADRHGPLRDERTGLVVAVAGRFGRVGEGGGQAGPGDTGCARWALERWLESGPRFLAEVAGSFTILAADPERGRLTLVRDHLGDVAVSYRLDDRRLVAATEPGALLRDPLASAEPDLHAAARFLGFRFGHTERSFFRGIRGLPPGHLLKVAGGEHVVEPYWRFRVATPGRDGRDAAEDLVAHLRRALRFHLEGIAPERVALSLSGGLDATALAALAPPGLRAYSWTFEATPDPDERANIEAVSAHLGLAVRWVDGDDRGPLSAGFAPRFVHPSSPYVNPFAALKAELYAAARADGCRRVVVGDGGDVLYGPRDFWLRDALVDLRAWAVAGLGRAVVRALDGDPESRAALRLLIPEPVRAAARATLGGRKPPWLTPEGASLLPPEPLSPVLPDGAAGRRCDLSVGVRNVELESEERRLFAGCGVERANPFWYWPLLEAVAALPAYRLHRDGRDKLLTREAMRGRLPERVLDSGRVGLLGDVFLRGIEARRELIRDLVFRRPRSEWQRLVRREWLEPFLDGTGAIAFGHTILWRVICYELWVRRLDDPASLPQ